ncbi:phosphate transporter [Stylosanthes scabra]|uniref:Phosphate transporter n=1 Tax=Stylosanthes scabra TaxID=79078 RepID=A0ABU6X3K6_9FABA|nr:phosphate transporter [Stylosanthes scabra]
MQAAIDIEKVMDISLTQIVEEENLPPGSNYALFSKEFFRRHGCDLFACAFNWFLVDTVFYSSILFQSQIYKIENIDKVDVYQEAIDIATLQAKIVVCSTIPGYFFSAYFIDRVGRVRIQMMGFFFMALAFFAIGIRYDSYWTKKSHKYGFLVLYGVAFFFANFGPNTTTFIVPAELFPARFRSTCNGISGAAGKIGAIVGSVGFLWASHGKNEDREGFPHSVGIGMNASLCILGGVCLVGFVVTTFFTKETMGRSLEDNETEPLETEEMNDL